VWPISSCARFFKELSRLPFADKSASEQLPSLAATFSVSTGFRELSLSLFPTEALALVLLDEPE